jgi:hypothetical protein
MVEAGQRVGTGQPVEQWPWTWLYLVALVKQARSVYERAAYDKEPKSAVPPKWMFWDNDALEEWFEERRKNKQGHTE